MASGIDSDALEYIFNHVFMPWDPPSKPGENEIQYDHLMASLMCEYAKSFTPHIREDERGQWKHVVNLLNRIVELHATSMLGKNEIRDILARMNSGDSIALLIRAQNAGLLIRRGESDTTFGSFEVSLSNAVVIGTIGKVSCSYPGPAITVPNTVVDDAFRTQLSEFLHIMSGTIIADAAPKTRKAGSEVYEERDTAHPKYITELLTGILRGHRGIAADVERIVKRIGDDVVCRDGGGSPWRRSPLWLVIRVALQTTLHPNVGLYKAFMVSFMGGLLEKAVAHDFSSTSLSWMMAKISRRLRKLETGEQEVLASKIFLIIKSAQQLRSRRWEEVQSSHPSSLNFNLSSLDFEADTMQTLPNSKSYIMGRLSDSLCADSIASFHPTHARRLAHDPAEFDATQLHKALSAEPLLGLSDFEDQVEQELDSWIEKNMDKLSAVESIGECISIYRGKADEHYSKNPEEASTMLLTLFSLWVGLDRLVVAQHPLLAQYSPEVPVDLLHPLLLRREHQLLRLLTIEEYVKRRHRSQSSPVSIYEPEQGVYDSFPVRYFGSSSSLESLKRKIVLDAERERELKTNELTSKNAEHARLMTSAQCIDHEYYQDYYRSISRHSSTCHKCRLEHDAETMRIDVHEWPLPGDEDKAKATVFELRCPRAFQIWRDATYELLYEICRPKDSQGPRDSCDASVELKGYAGLSEAASKSTFSRISLASAPKSFLDAHYRSTKIPAQKSSVIVPNGLLLHLHDSEGAWINPFSSCSIVTHCETPVSGPPDPYHSLAHTINGVTTTSNQMLASQKNCPLNLGLDEFLQFGTIRSGPRLQWMNIAREYASRSLSFHSEDVASLLLQASLQVGPRGCSDDPLDKATDRDWHIDLASADFGTTLVSQMQERLNIVRDNWQNIPAVGSIVLLTSRLLVSSIDIHVHERAYVLMRDARAIAHGWVHELSDKLRQCRNPHETSSMQRKICKAAVVCQSTLDVERCHQFKLLASPQDLKVFIECAVHIHDHTPPHTSSLPHDVRRMLDRERRLSHRLEDVVRKAALSDATGLDAALLYIWPSYARDAPWEQLSIPNERWMATRTREGSMVHLNLLDGSLLVDGKPLSRLPKSFASHPTYVRLLQSTILDVVPSRKPGMDFATRSLVQEHTLHFGMSGSDLIIQADLEGAIYELIPHQKLMGDFPDMLIEDFIHWLSKAIGVVEFRPMTSPWIKNSLNWRLHLQGKAKMQIGSGTSKLVDYHSATWRFAETILLPLDSRNKILLTLTGPLLSITLSRYGLQFEVEHGSGRLKSQNFRDMVIDTNQSSGTFIGLHNQLILRPISDELRELPRSRIVIVPHGIVKAMTSGHHATVSIATSGRARVRFHKYEIDDTILHRLVGDFTLESTLYKILLHSVTSHCLPDPLTGNTGVEEALAGLSSARCLSFQSLSTEELGLLSSIAELTPVEVCYPQYLCVMRTMAEPRTPYCHHPDFLIFVQRIFERATSLSIFNPMTKLALPKKPKHDLGLLRRTALRKGVMYSVEALSMQHSKDDDTVDEGRHHINADNRAEQRIATISYSSYSWETHLPATKDLEKTITSLYSLEAANEPWSLSRWVEHSEPQLSLRYLWLPMYNFLRGVGSRRSRSELAFHLATLSFISPEVNVLAPSLILLATCPEFYGVSVPEGQYSFGEYGFEPMRDKIQSIIYKNRRPQSECPSSHLSQRANESLGAFHKREQVAYDEAAAAADVASMADASIKLWPISELQQLRYHSWRWINVSQAIDEVTPSFCRWFENREFRLHVQQLQDMLNKRSSSGWASGLPLYVIPLSFPAEGRALPVSLDYILLRAIPHVPQVLNCLPPPPEVLDLAQVELPVRPAALDTLLIEMRDDNNLCRQKYANDLQKSLSAVGSLPAFPDYTLLEWMELRSYRGRCITQLDECLSEIRNSLQPRSVTDRITDMSGQWPRMTTVVLMQSVASNSQENLPDEWKVTFMCLGRAILALQKSQRLVGHLLRRSFEDFHKELVTPECPIDNPDWMLIQIDNNFAIRPIQLEVAHEMISPSSGKNMALQLNMGEGKSAVIVPLVVASLADGSRLTRVIVPKSLVNQTFRTLAERLCGLTNRPIYYLPFSRDIQLSSSALACLCRLQDECAKDGGVMITQPEHLLSFKLMGADLMLSGNASLGASMLERQRWIRANVRDILDESDELLRVSYQLIYTSGKQFPMDGHPDRWDAVVREILPLVKQYIMENSKPGIEVYIRDTNRAATTYPLLRITDESAGKALVEALVPLIIDTAKFQNLGEEGRLLLQEFILARHGPEHASTLAVIAQNKSTSLWKYILLLRGLFGQGLLLFALKERRYRVDYGLHLSRPTLLAVPYRAKDVPSPRADFGHPDTAVVLTSLSYLYGGLTSDQLATCFELLIKLDDPASQYELWTRHEISLPPSLREYPGLNLDDHDQRRTLQLLKDNQAVIQFYLTNVVFPKEAKEFPRKLCTTAWDLADKRENVVTGFSGTNDNHPLLPTSIQQLDPVGQSMTNARMLLYLLLPENDHYLPLTDTNNEPLTSEHVLKAVARQEPTVRVLLDVGAQMLDMTNLQVADHWLSLENEAAARAAIFFNDRDEAEVLTRDGRIESFVTSPFNRQLDECLLYLDDAHTRGTDFRIPSGVRAAVTLGPKLTKDRLVQGVMRMRRLGHGHSVMFLAPSEVDRSIRELTGTTNKAIGTVDILRWTIRETCAQIVRYVPQWAEQGVDFKRRDDALQRQWELPSSSSVEALKSAWLQPEAKSLEQMYTPESASSSTPMEPWSDPEIAERCRSLGVFSLTNKGLDEEQEREVSQEMEREPEIQRPPLVKPATHSLHPDVELFVLTGCVPYRSSAFESLFSPLQPQTPGAQWSDLLLATKDFAITIVRPSQSIDDYLRPIHWVVSSEVSPVLVVMSPYEVNELLQRIRRSSYVHLHQFAARVTREMRSFDDLKFYMVPSGPKDWSLSRQLARDMEQLCLWAGQSYFRDYDAYLRLCAFLGVATQETHSHVRRGPDGWVKPEDRGGTEFAGQCAFEANPLPVMNNVIGLRRKGLGYEETHLGAILMLQRPRWLKRGDF